jgi:transcriptional regulator with XRE-family HTH domain
MRKGWSSREIATFVGINQSNIVRMELGETNSPNPAVLTALAKWLDLNPADLYALAGYTRPDALPALEPYLRSKFADMPAEARAELERSFKQIANKYGYDADGPALGEDEY